MHIPNTSQQVQYTYMTEIQVLWNYSHSVFLNEIYSIPTNRDTIIRNLSVCFLSDDVYRR